MIGIHSFILPILIMQFIPIYSWCRSSSQHHAWLEIKTTEKKEKERCVSPLQLLSAKLTSRAALWRLADRRKKFDGEKGKKPQKNTVWEWREERKKWKWEPKWEEQERVIDEMEIVTERWWETWKNSERTGRHDGWGGKRRVRDKEGKKRKKESQEHTNEVIDKEAARKKGWGRRKLLQRVRCGDV